MEGVRFRTACLAATLVGLGAVASAADDQPAAVSDEYVRGYVAAVLERELGLQAPSLTVHQGVVHLAASELAAVEAARVLEALSGVAGVRQVQIEPAGGAGAVAGSAEPGAAGGEHATLGTTQPRAKGYELPEGLFPEGLLFAPLIADPRWPHLSTSLQRYTDGGLSDVWSATFGHTFVLWRDSAPEGGQWEIGLPAAVFAVFDLDAESNDLVNADYWVGAENSWRWGKLAVLARLFHQSSHLGDEFILTHPGVERVNLSYEAVDLKVSYDLAGGFRPYGGGGRVVHQDPSGFDPLNVEYGLEWRSPQTYLSGHLRPVAAVDVRHWEETDWDADVSARAGVQIEKAPNSWPVLQLLLEFYDGHSPNGQFFERDIQYFGAGIHAYY